MAEVEFERVDSLDPITPPSSPSAPRTLLLTGATGFLGQAIAHACLQQSAFEKIYVLVRGRKGRRGRSDLSAAERFAPIVAGWEKAFGPHVGRGPGRAGAYTRP